MFQGWKPSLLDLCLVLIQGLQGQRVEIEVFFDKFVSPKDVWMVLPATLTKTNDPWILAVDGKWLHRNGVVMIYRDITNRENIFWSFHSSESYPALCTDLGTLSGLLGSRLPSGVISDWKGSIRAGVATYFGDIPHQRCLTHVSREAKRFLPKRSSFRAVLVLSFSDQAARGWTNTP